MNFASTLALSRMIAQAIYLRVIASKAEVLETKRNVHKLTMAERESLSKRLIKRLGGTPYVLFDSRGYSHTVPAKDLLSAVGYHHYLMPEKELVAWTVNDESKNFLELFKGAVPLAKTEDYIDAYKRAVARLRDDDDDEPKTMVNAGFLTGATIEVGSNGNVAGFGLIAISDDIQTTEFLQDGTLLNKRLAMRPVDDDGQGVRYWIVERGQQPVSPTPVMHPLLQVTPLPDAWGKGVYR